MALATLSIWPGLALAEEQLSGEDAAHIDWAVKNCGVKSTDKEHAMVDQANAKDAIVFLRKYLRKYLSKNLRDAQSSPRACDDVRGYQGLVWCLWQQVCPSHQMAERPPRRPTHRQAPRLA